MARGTFVLADIGGYTSFLSDVGIEHAKEITSHLLNGLHAVDPEGWRVGNVEGDCLFLYNDDPRAADTAFDYVCRLYERFREGIEEIVAGSTCKCGACDRSGDLTLKFVVHTGEFETHEIAGRTELIGPEVVVAHRLLKNSVPVREYALLTEPLRGAVDGCGYECNSASDAYDDVGSVDYQYVDLAALRDDWRKRREVYLDDADADLAMSVAIDAPPQLVWDLMADATNMVGTHPTMLELDMLTGSLSDVGSVHTCFHGEAIGKMVHQVIAFDSKTFRATHLVSNVQIVDRMYHSWECVDDGTGGTILSMRYSLEPGASLDQATRDLFLEGLREHNDGDVAGLKRQAEELAGPPG